MSKYERVYIRFRNRVIGPISHDKAESLVKQRQVTKEHQLSSDSITWHPAEEFFRTAFVQLEQVRGETAPPSAESHDHPTTGSSPPPSATAETPPDLGGRAPSGWSFQSSGDSATNGPSVSLKSITVYLNRLRIWCSIMACLGMVVAICFAGHAIFKLMLRLSRDETTAISQADAINLSMTLAFYLGVFACSIFLVRFSLSVGTIRYAANPQSIEAAFLRLEYFWICATYFSVISFIGTLFYFLLTLLFKPGTA